MGQADSPVSAPGQSDDLPATVELLVVGGGVMGLWAALKAGRMGIETLLVEAERPGFGASGGILGALMAHMPDRWNDKKQFQLDALVALEGEIARLEGETGISCGYRRCGRLIPLPKPHLLPIAEGHAADAAQNWTVGERRFGWQVHDQSPLPGWLSPGAAAAGVVEDGLAARVAPRSLIAALTAAIDRTANIRRVSGTGVSRLDPTSARLSDGRLVAFGHCIVAAGPHSFELLSGFGGKLSRPLGRAVKGQAALLRADGLDPSLPVIFLNGLYIVAHEDGHVAIGSTSEEEFDDPMATDGKLDRLIERARDLSPSLTDAPVVERWAGLRPKAIDRDPMVGAHPDAPQILALTGGFKVSFGIAHRLADAALAQLSGKPTDLPSSFSLQHHLEVASASPKP
ncbi:FAD-dependent oxidoreductase [Rhizobium sp. 0TCS1.26]|uniref:NAD(P)/FAD-dependent oxidoreductase n=1 Tax=Rhizobium sp. 0TCS1.26 TaxID=3142623 RepID=UPI003D2C2E3B